MGHQGNKQVNVFI